MTVRYWCCVAMLAILAVVAWPAPANDCCSLRIVVLDEDGNYLPYRVAQFTDRRSGSDLQRRFGRGMLGKPLASGTYAFEVVRSDVERPRSTTIRGEVFVAPTNQALLLWAPRNVAVKAGAELDLDEYRNPVNVTFEMVGEAVQKGPAYARLYHVTTGATLEVEVRRGEISFRGARPGQHLLIVLIRGKVACAEAVTLSDTAGEIAADQKFRLSCRVGG